MYELGTTALKANKYDSTCSLEVDGNVGLSKFGELLGFVENTHIEVNNILTSPNKVEINRGLRYVTICSESLKGTVSHYTDIESRVPIDKGAYDR